ncbi:oxysterol-binding protein-related protein 2A-like isoform X3 [Vigna umbellata]|uniref:oxysterol-binding protein-related protein 2A-like isoform X3 n=1 Tax=Vigna umbellata TaxID=87088 RepID=UPI001F5F73C2|nr:oxysterol-binding protein-related protein 2A-like isoform X3 [Vigna umbellata]
MRVKEMHQLCCISLESPGIGNHSPERMAARLFQTRSFPAVGSLGNAAQRWETTVAGVLYKWTNYGKGWRSRWFLLRNGVLSYAKIRCPENLNLLTSSDDISFIGEISTNRLARVDRVAPATRRKHRKASSSSRVVHLKAANTEPEATAIHDGEYQLTKNEFSSLGRGKYSECSTTESSDDIEKQEMEEVSDEDEISYYDTRDCFTEPDCKCCESERAINEVDRCREASTQCTDTENIYPEKMVCNYKHPQIARRKKLPDPVEKEKGVSLWSMIKDNVGKDLTRVCLPVYFNEPISSLQKCCEDLEYSYLLDLAHEYGKSGNGLLRALYVAAFAVSGYASSEGRNCKPFNPLLGETYEADYPEKGIRFFSEKVSHHPTLIACHCEGRGWKFWADSNIHSKFRGRSIQLDPVGVLTLEFNDGEIFQWSKVTTTIYNLILGKIYCDHHGNMDIRGNRKYSCRLKFKEQTILDRNPRQVHGYVEDVTGKKVATLFGKWDDSMYYMSGNVNVKPKDLNSPNASLLWKRTMESPNVTRYNLTPFAITLNELTPGLKENLPPTDSRLRPDQRHLENGEYDKANLEKQRLEKRQRMSRKIQENGWKPRWFRREGESGTFRYIGGYWEARELRSWDGCPDIFSEINEESADSFGAF